MTVGARAPAVEAQSADAPAKCQQLRKHTCSCWVQADGERWLQQYTNVCANPSYDRNVVASKFEPQCLVSFESCEECACVEIAEPGSADNSCQTVCG